MPKNVNVTSNAPTLKILKCQKLPRLIVIFFLERKSLSYVNFKMSLKSYTESIDTDFLEF